MKRAKITKEPKLHIHNYVVAICRKCVPKKGRPYWATGYRYAVNLKEVRKIRDEVLDHNPAARVLVFKASHDFREAWLA